VLLPADATGLIAALDVAELGEAIASIARTNIETECDRNAREFDVGGIYALSLEELIAGLRSIHSGKPALRISVPALLARAVSHVCDLLHITPYSFGHYQLLRHDNCPCRNRLPELLGRAPKVIGAQQGLTSSKGMLAFVRPDLN
jgi:hypothetical protein